jgi:dolichol-phosphate mannosyltransferase
VGKPFSSVIADTHFARLPSAVSLPWVGTVTQKDARRIAKFCLVGLSGVGVATASLWLARDILALPLLVSGIVAHITSVTNNFILNQVWTFADRRDGATPAVILGRWLKYSLSTLVAAGIYLGVLALLTDVLGIHHLLSGLCAIAVATPVNFVASNLWVWRTSRQVNAAHKE